MQKDKKKTKPTDEQIKLVKGSRAKKLADNKIVKK